MKLHSAAVVRNVYCQVCEDDYHLTQHKCKTSGWQKLYPQEISTRRWVSRW